MKLLKFRVLGLPEIESTSWLEVGPGLNVLRTDDDVPPFRVLHMLQTVNPPYLIEANDPFADLPQYRQWKQYKLRILPAKKTVAIAIYSTPAGLVEELAALDQSLYAADWVEVGRRRDLSRWMSFVELSESGRWSELHDLLADILDTVQERPEPEIAALRQHLLSRRPTDRIRRELAAELKHLFHLLQPLVPQEKRDKLTLCLDIIGRAERFEQAHQLIYSRLPLFLLVTAKGRTVTMGNVNGEDGFSFLLTQWEQMAGKSGLVDVEKARLNQSFRILYPHLPLSFEKKNGILSMQATTTADQPVDHAASTLETLHYVLAGSTVLHKAVYGCKPLFLLDLSQLKCTDKEEEQLRAMLLRFFAEQQCLLILPRPLLDRISKDFTKEQVNYLNL